MSATMKARAAVGAVLFAGFALLSVGCSMKAPITPVPPAPAPVTVPPVTQSLPMPGL